jgi:hypothetical protein
LKEVRNYVGGKNLWSDLAFCSCGCRPFVFDRVSELDSFNTFRQGRDGTDFYGHDRNTPVVGDSSNIAETRAQVI